MTSYENVDDRRIKHLEMIQAVIGRLGNDSFLVKGWAVTVAGAFFGFAVNSSSWRLALASLLPTLSFWGLDAYFLRSERLFRVLYERVRTDADENGAFFMAATSETFIDSLPQGAERDVALYRKAFWRPTLRVFYGALVVSALVVMIVICVD